MIVGSEIPDDDENIAWRQHDVYKQALEIIVLEANRYARMARQILSDSHYDGWGETRHVDHRTLQAAHDLLAAVWRWYYLNPEFNFTDVPEQNLEDEWLHWLAREVAKWVDAPELVRLIQIILSHQNEDIGYAAEAKLSLEVLERFQHLPWPEGKAEPFKSDFAKYPLDFLDDPIGHSEKPSCPYNTYIFPIKNVRLG